MADSAKISAASCEDPALYASALPDSKRRFRLPNLRCPSGKEYRKDTVLPSPLAEARTQPAPLKVVEDDLKQDEVLLEYVLDNPNSYCVLISRQGAFVRLLPTGRKEIDKLAHQYVDEIRGKGSGTEISKQLYERLLKPIPEISKADRILVVPDGHIASAAIRGPSR